ncbi:hypothetical protein TRICI_002508 [Trichomonascus ciferrii]|uniref:MINDY deubiquitinase domain-containing protein n=1 Tax=Trichomonascus ciferrii TaxID=44093 RepID=A0A642V6E8_9ASCO|nr:hypothetical protein TRICI_002508 [Trichomonascus ciferrii]
MSSSSGSTEVTEFETKTIRIGEGECTILLQNENGPCPLVALVNTLILNEVGAGEAQSSKVSLSSYTSGKDKILVKTLLELLGEVLVEKSTQYGQVEAGKFNEDVNEVLALLPKLVTGMNINVRFNGSFDDTAEMSLFRLYDVDVVHGWICDPEDPEYDLIDQVGSYDEAQSTILKDNEESGQNEEMHTKAEAVKHFMQLNATQLTTYGLQFLRDLLSEDSPAVLFRNDHFATIYKHNGTLYTLVADQGYKHEKSMVWQSLTSVNGASDAFYTSSFKAPTEDQPTNTDTAAQQTGQHDYDLARQLQIDEDAQLAAQLNQPRTQSRNTRQQQKSTSSKQPKDKKSKCTIM